MGNVHKLNAGLWDDREVEVHTDYDHQVWSDEDDPPCSHAHSRREIPLGDKIKPSIHYTVPRVLIAANEGGYNSTGVCVDCLLEQLNGHLGT